MHKFYLKIFNGCSAGAFGIRVWIYQENRDYLDEDSLFEIYSDSTFDHRIPFFAKFHDLKIRGVLDFEYDILSDKNYFHQFNNIGAQDICPFIEKILAGQKYNTFGVEIN